MRLVMFYGLDQILVRSSNEDAWVMHQTWGDEEFVNSLSENRKRRDSSVDLGLEERTLLKLVLKNGM
jgi:hypothetical protein